MRNELFSFRVITKILLLLPGCVEQIRKGRHTITFLWRTIILSLKHKTMQTYLTENQEYKQIIEDLSEVTGMLWQKGWAERNAGNISFNISHLFEDELPNTDFEPYKPLSTGYPHLSNAMLLVSATGSRMRNLAKKPYENTCIINLDSEGKRYRQMLKPELDSPLLPTSEFPAHLAIHEMLNSAGRPEKVVVHTHPDNLLSLSHIRAFCNEETLNNMLWSMQPETLVFVSEGIGFVPYLMTGSEKLAAATIRKLEKHRVVMWEKHGCLAIGNTANEAFDLLDVLDKSASIFLTCKSAGYDAEGISKEELDNLRKKFDL